MTDNKAAVVVLALAGAVLLAGSAAVSSGYLRPYGEGAILKEIADEDSALCLKFGFSAASQGFLQCMADLADLRQRHVRLLAAYQWI